MNTIFQFFNFLLVDGNLFAEEGKGGCWHLLASLSSVFYSKFDS